MNTNTTTTKETNAAKQQNGERWMRRLVRDLIPWRKILGIAALLIAAAALIIPMVIADGMAKTALIWALSLGLTGLIVFGICMLDD